MNTEPQRLDRKKLSTLLSGLATVMATCALGQMSAWAESPASPPPSPPETLSADAAPTSSEPAPPPSPGTDVAPTSPPVEDLLSGLDKELGKLKDQLAGTLSGYQISSLEAVGEPAPGSTPGIHSVPLALKVAPTGGGDTVTVDLSAQRDPAGKWTMPGAGEVRESLRRKIAGNSALSGQGVVGSTAPESTGGGKPAIDISAPANLESVSKTARAQEDITGAAPLPESLTLPFNKNAAPVVPLDGEMPSSSDLSPVPTTGKPYTPPVTSLDGPIDGALSPQTGEALQPSNALTPNSPKGPGASLDLHPGMGDDSALTPVEGTGGRTNGGPGSGPSLPPKTEGTGPSLD